MLNVLNLLVILNETIHYHSCFALFSSLYYFAVNNLVLNSCHCTGCKYVLKPGQSTNCCMHILAYYLSFKRSFIWQEHPFLNLLQPANNYLQTICHNFNFISTTNIISICANKITEFCFIDIHYIKKSKFQGKVVSYYCKISSNFI